MLTQEGFKRKRYEDFITEMEDRARELWGADVNLSERGPLGMFIQNISYARAEENELAEAIYYSGFYFVAEGKSLDYVVKNRGMSREKAEKSIGIAEFGVDAGIAVPAGLTISTKDGIGFITTETTPDTDNDGKVQVPIEALQEGSAGNVLSDTIVEIVTPAIGVNSVTNPIQTLYGREAETDTELRQRYANTFTVASSNPDGIRTKLLNEVPGVRAAVVFENDDSVTDEEGRPPHSFEVVVYGGDDEDITKAIFEAKPGGVRAYGANEFAILDESGNEHTIGFSKAVEKPIFVRITVYRGGSFPAISMGKNMVKSEVVKYIGGLDQDGIMYNGLGMGDSVINAKLAGNIFYNVPGIKDCVVEFSDNLGGTWYTSNVQVDRLSVASTTHERIEVNVL